MGVGRLERIDGSGAVAIVAPFECERAVNLDGDPVVDISFQANVAGQPTAPMLEEFGQVGLKLWPPLRLKVRVLIGPGR
jgi:hypothetical protein